jgi:hypothetical protein
LPLLKVKEPFFHLKKNKTALDIPGHQRGKFALAKRADKIPLLGLTKICKQAMTMIVY